MSAAVLTTAAGYIRELVEKGPDSLPDSLPEEVSAEIVRRYVTEHHARLQREAVIVAEVQAREAIKKTPRRTSGQVVDDLYRIARRKAWEKVLGMSFATGDGEKPTWHAATSAQHQMRIEMQSRLVSEVQQDIDLHREALEDLRRFGIERLEQL